MRRIPASFPLCMDARMLGPGGTGVARYAAALATAQRQLGGRAMRLRDAPDRRIGRWLTAAWPLGVRVAAGLDGEGVEQLHAPRLFRAAQVHFGMYGRPFRVVPPFAPGLMHWTYPVPMRMAGWINLYTVHDVIPLDRPDLSPVDPGRLRRVLMGIVRRGDIMVAVSDAARERIVAQLGCAPAQVVNCYQPVVPVTVAGDVSLPAGLRAGGYFLYCGLDEPRKNLPRLIAAHRRSGVAAPLVIAGPPPVDGGRAVPEGQGGVIRLPYLPDEQLAALQASAIALLFPSLAEGFGLPVVEAMAVGTPVLTSATGALAEVAGDAALLVDPENGDAIADGIARLAHDRALRDRLRAAGPRRAARFSAARFSARLRRLYAGAIERAGRA